MKIDLWRALGITAGAVLVSLVANVFVYGLAVALQTADIISTAVAAVILAGFSYLYFKGGPSPSAKSGFGLALVMFGYTFATGFLSGFLAAIQGVQISFPPVSPMVMIAGAVLAFAVPTLTGWYIGRSK
jgi:hypothetical protein